MGITLRKSHGRIRFSGNFSGAIQEQVGEEPACAERSRDAETFVTGGEPDAVTRLGWADERQFIRCGGTMTGPYASGGEFPKARHVFESTIKHAVENMLIHSGAVGVELTGRADEHLAGFARLNVECNRIFAAAMSAFQIAELDDLVANEAGKTIGNNEMPLSFSNGQAAGQSG